MSKDGKIDGFAILRKGGGREWIADVITYGEQGNYNDESGARVDAKGKILYDGDEVVRVTIERAKP